MEYHGTCHCGAVAFSVESDAHLMVHECNCSICSKVGYLHLIVPRTQFKLLRGETSLTTYTFNSHVAQHYFCATCGVKPFYVPRSNPDGMDINVRCLEPAPEHMTIEPFDGRNWEQHAHTLAHLSKPA